MKLVGGFVALVLLIVVCVNVRNLVVSTLDYYEKEQDRVQAERDARKRAKDEAAAAQWIADAPKRKAEAEAVAAAENARILEQARIRDEQEKVRKGKLAQEKKNADELESARAEKAELEAVLNGADEAKIAGLNAFLDRHPNSKYYEQAQGVIEKLNEPMHAYFDAWREANGEIPTVQLISVSGGNFAQELVNTALAAHRNEDYSSALKAFKDAEKEYDKLRRRYAGRDDIQMGASVFNAYLMQFMQVQTEFNIALKGKDPSLIGVKHIKFELESLKLQRDAIVGIVDLEPDFKIYSRPILKI